MLRAFFVQLLCIRNKDIKITCCVLRGRCFSYYFTSLLWTRSFSHRLSRDRETCTGPGGRRDASACVSPALCATSLLDPGYDHYDGCDVVILRVCRALLLEWVLFLKNLSSLEFSDADFVISENRWYQSVDDIVSVSVTLFFAIYFSTFMNLIKCT